MTGLSTINGGISLGFALGSNFNQAIKVRKAHHFCQWH